MVVSTLKEAMDIFPTGSSILIVENMIGLHLQRDLKEVDYLEPLQFGI